MAGDGTGSPTITFASRLTDGSRLGKAAFDEFQQFSGLLQGFFDSLGARADGSFGNIVVESIQIVPNFTTLPAPPAGSMQIFSQTNHLVATISGVDDSPASGQRVMLIDQSDADGVRLLTLYGEMRIGLQGAFGGSGASGPALVWPTDEWAIGPAIMAATTKKVLGVFDISGNRTPFLFAKDVFSLGADSFYYGPDRNLAPAITAYLGHRSSSNYRWTEVAANKLYAENGVEERARTVPMGEWTTFTPTKTAATGTWTGGTNTTAKYMLIGKTMFVAFYIGGTTVSSATSSLSIAIPASFVAASAMLTQAYAIDATNRTTIRAEVAASGTTIDLRRNDAGTFTAGTTDVRGELYFEVQ